MDCYNREALIRGKALGEVSREEILEHSPNAIRRMCNGCRQGQHNRTTLYEHPEHLRMP